jgi:tetrahydromethanopterin S-methyltransferase subunit G
MKHMKRASFDTLAYANGLKALDIPTKQAEGQARLLAGVFSENIATKQDIADLKRDMDAKFDKVDAKFDKVDAKFDKVDTKMDFKFAEMKTELSEFKSMIKWTFGIMLGVVVALFSAMKFLH